MAERRMLHRKASVSSDLAELYAKQGPSSVAFYLLMIPHFDRWGCVPDDAMKLRVMVVPTWEDVSAADVRGWLAWMTKRGMLSKITGPAGDKGLRSPDFHEHQVGSDFNRESPSLYEPPEITERWTRDGKKPNRADLQECRRQVADQSQTRRRLVTVKGSEGKGINPSPSLTALEVEESAAPPTEPEPGAQSPAPEVEDNGAGPPLKENGRVDLEAIAADAPPAIRAAIERARARVLTTDDERSD